MSDTIKAIKLTQMENELIEIRREIKKMEGIIKSEKVARKFKRMSKNLMPGLIQRRDELINKITEESLLHE